MLLFGLINCCQICKGEKRGGECEEKFVDSICSTYAHRMNIYMYGVAKMEERMLLMVATYKWIDYEYLLHNFSSSL